MDATATTPVKGALTSYTGVEHRRKVRIYEPFLARVHGVDASGEAFDIETTLDNLSASGLYLRLPRIVEQGAELLVDIVFSTAPNQGTTVARVATHGVVLRTEPHHAGLAGLAVAFTRHRFL